VTGITGAGKSSLVNQLIRRYRDAGSTVGVVAEDPTSPFSGGALLGDRVRMLDSHGDPGVFIRSIASRGNETGLSETATELGDVLDAFGRDVVFLETIGVGQLEYKIRYSAHTTVVVLTPHAGDDVQSLKSGLMEVGEIFAINKADRPTAGRYADDLESMLELRASGDGWRPRVVSTVGTTGEGVDGLVEAIGEHRAYLEGDGRFEARRVEALRARLALLAEEKVREKFRKNGYIRDQLERVLEDVVSGKQSPYQAADTISKHISIRAEEGDDG
jgi:LAO/AO transport system kinase